MRTVGLMAAFLAAFFMAGCTAAGRVDDLVDRGKDRLLDVIERQVEEANRHYDRLLLEYQEDGARLYRLGVLMGRIPK